MAYDSVRAQLDKLLGADRNGPLTGANKSLISYTDPSICKHFLLGFCPHDLHIKHRSEPGSCARQHSSAAKLEYERDRDAGRLKGDVRRWTRDLVNECRVILEDEERKIRGHARRLQETYKAGGDLAGLMIKNFDTLKKLGMVSPNAKIRVLNETEDFEDSLGAESKEKSEDQDTTRSKEESEDNAGRTDDNNSPRSVEKADHEESTSDHDVTGTDDDEDGDGDLDGFGVIKVIPADGNSSEKSPGETGVDEETGKRMATNAKYASESNGANEKVFTASESSDSSDENGGKKDVSTTINKAEDQDRAKGDNTASISPISRVNKETVANGTHERPGLEEGEVSRPEPVDKMEEFYKKGVGPDGLLMLDRKQSLRVCACCGGFISLVDAESRLLSHYGGKSHHSLALLREKVVELEKQVTAERRFSRDRSYDYYQRDRRDGRDNHRSRREDYRLDDRYRDDRHSRHWDRSDRYKERYDRDSGRRGYGTTNWYDRSARVRDEYGREERSRRRDDEYYRRDGRSDRYESGRKRHRSRSPVYSRQRPRY